MPGGYIALERAIHKVMHGFTVLDLQLQPPKNFKYTPKGHPSVQKILNQPFKFFSFGGESYIFCSDDGLWVLKVFKKHRLYPYTQLNFLKKFAFVHALLEKRQQSYARFWQSLKIQSELQEDLTQIGYIHLPDKLTDPYPATLVDPIGIAHSIDLSQIPFVLQKKGQLFSEQFDYQVTLKDQRAILKSALDFYYKLYTKGYKLWDMAPKRNLGFYHDQPFLIDTGSIAPIEKRESFLKCSRKLVKWVKKFHPEHLEYIMELSEAYASNGKGSKSLLPSYQSQALPK